MPDPAYYFDANPDADFYLMRMRIRMRIQVTKIMRIHADPDPQHTAVFQHLCVPDSHADEFSVIDLPEATSANLVEDR